MITVVTIETIRNEENVVDIRAALETEIPVGEEELEVSVPAPAVPDPPAAVDNWANPTDAGEERNTVYTFFRNVSPTTQVGLLLSGILFEPRLRSKMAPRHKGLRPLLIWPALKSSGLIGHACPPKANATVIFVLQGYA